jgi:hypothetical protein
VIIVFHVFSVAVDGEKQTPAAALLRFVVRACQRTLMFTRNRN